MATIFLSMLVLGLVITGMAVGVILQNKPIKGSCGGMSALGIDTECEICGGSRAKCEEVQKRTDLAYEAK